MHPLTEFARQFLLALGLAFTWPALADDQATSEFGHVTEILLPGFQQSALAKDLPAGDLLFTTPNSLMILGERSIWEWRLADRALRRLPLSDGDATGSHLVSFGTSGVHLFAAAEDALFQVDWEQGRVFRYSNPLPPTHPLGFAGKGDNFWLLQAGSLLKFDVTARSLVPRIKAPFLLTHDKPLLDPETKILWILRGTTLFRVNLADPSGQFTAKLTARHRLLDLQTSASGLLMHTAHTVMRISNEGKLLRSIPVEGRRKLVKMTITNEAHAYLFDDHLLEIFRLRDQRTLRVRLPLEDTEPVTTLRISGALVALVADGRPRIFLVDHGR